MYTMSDVPKAYACFCHLMTRSATRFDRVSERGIQVDLQRLRNLLQFEDPELASAIRSMVGAVCLLCDPRDAVSPPYGVIPSGASDAYDCRGFCTLHARK